MKHNRLPSRRFIYSVTALLGASFTFILFLLAWFNSIDKAQKEFAFESVSVNALINRAASRAHDATITIAKVLETHQESGQASFEPFTRSILDRHSFIESIAYYHLKPNELRNFQYSLQRSLFCEYYIARDPDAVCTVDEKFMASDEVRNAIDSTIQTGLVVPTPVFKEAGKQRTYMLTKSVTQVLPYGEDLRTGGENIGLVFVSINPEALLGHSFSDKLSVRLQSESEGIVGRQLLFRKRPNRELLDKGWLITNLEEDALIQFPYYSTKLTIKRPVFWSDLDQKLIFIALFLGGGVTLLLVALARAKEIQARELRERNKEIERQVERQTRELATTRDQALEASRVKSEFLASMSHEIRTPLNAIIGMAELLAETKLVGEQQRYVSIFKKSGEALLSLVNDILDLSKIEAGQLIIEKIDFNLPNLVEEATDIYSLKTDEKGIELICQVVPDIPTWVKGDPGRLRQIVLNLIGNAIKFTEKGEIVIRVKPVSEQDDACYLHFSVSDTGIGIPAAKLDSIFGSFNQVDSSTTRKYGGTGLGLTISRSLVKLMGGRMWVESSEDEGSCFHFTIRLMEGEPMDDIVTTSVQDLSNRRVLVIDDNDTNRLILRETLSQRGVVVTEASDGKTGVEMVKVANDQDKPYDLILSDCHMPGMDGFEVIEEIKKLNGDVKTVLMLSSSNLSRDIERAREQQLGGYLVKPVRSEELFRAVAGTIAMSPQGDSSHLNTIERKSFVGCAPILLVEDNEDNRLLVNAYLKKTTFQVVEAENGQIALEKFSSGEFSLVLMDVQMPVMDGHTASREIRRWESENGREPTPIVALSAHAVKEDMDKSIQAGCNAHLTKPIKKATLLHTIDQFIR